MEESGHGFWHLIHILWYMFSLYLKLIFILSLFITLWDFLRGFLPKSLELWLVAPAQKICNFVYGFCFCLIFPFYYVIVVIKTFVLVFSEVVIILAKDSLISLGGTKLKLFEKIKWAFLSESLFVRSLSNLRFSQPLDTMHF